MWFQDFQDGCHGEHLGYQNGIILAILNLHQPRCLPLSFLSIQLTVPEQITIEDLQDSRRRCCWKIFKIDDNFSNSKISISLWCLQSSFDSIGLMVWEEMSFEELQDGRHNGNLGYLNKRILAILKLCVTVMLPIKFWLNPTYSSEGDFIWRISRWSPWWSTWISEWYNFSRIFMLFQCLPSSSGSISPMVWEEMCLKYFKMAAIVSLLDMGTEWF